MSNKLISMTKINTALNDWRRIYEANSKEENDKWANADELIQKIYYEILEIRSK